MPAAKHKRPFHSPNRRSPCPVACVLDAIGDRWTLLIIRDLMLGRTRFKDFSDSPEGIPSNILSERLQRLARSDFVKQVPVPGSTKRFEYQLTKKGASLRPIVELVRDWGLVWEPNTSAVINRKTDR